jgi:hypothetical protein
MDGWNVEWNGRERSGWVEKNGRNRKTPRVLRHRQIKFRRNFGAAVTVNRVLKDGSVDFADPYICLG